MIASSYQPVLKQRRFIWTSWIIIYSYTQIQKDNKQDRSFKQNNNIIKTTKIHYPTELNDPVWLFIHWNRLKPNWLNVSQLEAGICHLAGGDFAGEGAFAYGNVSKQQDEAIILYNVILNILMNNLNMDVLLNVMML